MNLGYESGDQVGAFDEKKTEVKNLVQVYLSALVRKQWLYSA
jgi:hypothetical protein